MNERLKWIRAYKKMSQNEFAKSLGIGQSTLAMMEVGKREITERHIKTICAIFRIDEHWFRTGSGDPFCQDNQSIVERVAEQYGLTEKERSIVADFLKLPSKDRTAVMQVVDSLVEKLATPQDSATAEITMPEQRKESLPTVPPPQVSESTSNIAAELAELKRQNQEILTQNRELLSQRDDLAERVAALEQEEDERGRTYGTA